MLVLAKNLGMLKCSENIGVVNRKKEESRV